MNFWTWWTRFVASFWPMEESAPADGALLLIATLPFAVLTILLAFLGLPIWLRFGLAVVLAMGVRIVPWFKRPESYHLNALGGYVLGEILTIVARR